MGEYLARRGLIFFLGVCLYLCLQTIHEKFAFFIHLQKDACFSMFQISSFSLLYFFKVDAGVCYIHLCIHKDYECGGGRVKLEKMLVNLDEDYPLENFD